MIWQSHIKIKYRVKVHKILCIFLSYFNYLNFASKSIGDFPYFSVLVIKQLFLNFGEVFAVKTFSGNCA